jgi:hypothetical protein
MTKAKFNWICYKCEGVIWAGTVYTLSFSRRYHPECFDESIDGQRIPWYRRKRWAVWQVGNWLL